MHPKNPFAEDYDFDLLIEHKPELKDFVFVNEHGTKTIKFGNQEAVRALNSSLLKSQYDLDWSLPKGYLCPPVPGRLDYLLYASDLLEKEDIRLLDIGTGANLIYPMLSKRHFNWKCTGSEVESVSLDHAQKIVDQNELLDDTDLRLQTNKNRIFENVIEAKDQFDLVVCNPPFFKNEQMAQKENQRKFKNLKLSESEKLNFGGKANELWFRGGEVAFIERMALESPQYKEQIHWFTSLVSRKENLKTIKRSIKKAGAKEIRVVEMGLGNKQSRFIAWTFK